MTEKKKDAYYWLGSAISLTLATCATVLIISAAITGTTLAFEWLMGLGQ